MTKEQKAQLLDYALTLGVNEISRGADGKPRFGRLTKHRPLSLAGLSIEEMHERLGRWIAEVRFVADGGDKGKEIALIFDDDDDDDAPVMEAEEKP